MSEKIYIDIRKPAVAGRFYPADAERLGVVIEKHLNAVPAAFFSNAPDKPAVKGVLVPHAGYEFSAPVAAYAYARLRGRKYDRVILIGNSHTSYFTGVAVDDHDAWQTPFGLVPLDRGFADMLAEADGDIKFDRQAHASEHSLEVQLPVLQSVLESGYKIVPLLFGNAGEDYYAKFTQALARTLGKHDLVVVSTDLSHYPAYKDANEIDTATLEAIRSADIAVLDKHISETEAAGFAGEETLICGIDAVKTVMALAQAQDWKKIDILKYANSGDTPGGDKARVVGYGALAFYESVEGGDLKADADCAELNAEQQKILLDIAKQTVEACVTRGQTAAYEVSDPRLAVPAGAFVTLRENGKLRGCIGQIIPTGAPLWQVVRDMAAAAATEDPRFRPVEARELSSLEYEVSVLSSPQAVADWQTIKLGKHGVIVRKGGRSGVFLPQVAEETGWDIEQFLSELCAGKAGLPPDSYKSDPEVRLEVFTAQVIE